MTQKKIHVSIDKSIMIETIHEPRICKKCSKEMNPVQAILSSAHGVCGKCCRKNHKLVISGRAPPE